MNINIKKASIRGSLFLNYEFEQSDLGVKNNIKTSSDAPIHDDLRMAFRSLIPHFAFVCEEIKNEALVKKAIKDPEAYLSDRESAPDDSFFKYRIFGFSVRDNKGQELLEISGAKQLENREEISFSTYDIDLGDNEYPFVSELNIVVETLKEEVLAYMQGKSAPKAQMEMFGDDDEGFEAVEAY